MLRAVAGARASTILANSGTDIAHTGTTDETVIATVTIPGGTMGLNGCIRVTTHWNYTNSANNKIMRVRFGGIGGTGYFSTTQTTTANFLNMCMIWNAGAANAQKGMVALGAVFGSSAGAQLTGTVDTSAATTLVMTAQLANTGETITLEAYTVELLL